MLLPGSQESVVSAFLEAMMEVRKLKTIIAALITYILYLHTDQMNSVGDVISANIIILVDGKLIMLMPRMPVSYA